MNYRSVVLFGTAAEVTGKEKERGLFVISENVVKGRWQEVRSPNEQELKATTVLRMTIETASAKIRTGPPKDDEEDYALPIWAGVVPVRQSFAAPEADAKLAADVALSPSVRSLLEGRHGN